MVPMFHPRLASELWLGNKMDELCSHDNNDHEEYDKKDDVDAND